MKIPIEQFIAYTGHCCKQIPSCFSYVGSSSTLLMPISHFPDPAIILQTTNHAPKSTQLIHFR